jgi:predicted ATPase
LGTTLFYLGEGRSGANHLERAVSLYDRRRHRDLVFRYSHDPGVMSLAYLALCLWWLGYPDQALIQSQAALDLANELSHPFSQAFAMLLSAVHYQFRGEPQRVRELAQVLLSHSSEHRLPTFAPMANMLEGWALVRLGKAEKGQARLRQGAADSMRIGNPIRLTYYPMLAEGYLALEQSRKGLATISEALAIVDNTGERWCEAELYRLKGELLLTDATNELEAESFFRNAVDIATAQNAKSFQLRSTISLVRLLQETNWHKEVLPQLSAIHERFAEGSQTPDVMAARTLLNNIPHL